VEQIAVAMKYAVQPVKLLVKQHHQVGLGQRLQVLLYPSFNTLYANTLIYLLLLSG